MQPTEQVVAHNKNCVLSLGSGHSVGPQKPLSKNTGKSVRLVCFWILHAWRESAQIKSLILFYKMVPGGTTILFKNII